MAKNKDKEVELTASEKMSNSVNLWLSKNIKLVGAIVIAVVAVLIIVAVASFVINKSNDAKYEKLDALVAVYSEYVSAEDNEEAKKTVVADAQAMAGNAKDYPSAKATLILADIAYDDGDYAKAIELYSKVADAQKKSFLREVALISLAAAYEDNGDAKSALKVYNDFFDEYDVNSFYSSRALFNAARLTEATDKALAISIYEQLVAYFENYGSEYASLAKTRVAQLN